MGRRHSGLHSSCVSFGVEGGLGRKRQVAGHGGVTKSGRESFSQAEGPRAGPKEEEPGMADSARREQGTSRKKEKAARRCRAAV